MISRFRTFIAGFLVVLPLAVTIPVIAWVGTLIYSNRPCAGPIGTGAGRRMPGLCPGAVGKAGGFRR
jgi:hypothetical protein